MKKIVLTGGGTGGHIWPHFALFDAPSSKLKKLTDQKELDVHYIGSRHGMEKSLVEKEKPQWNYHGIPTGKLRRYFSFKNFSDPILIIMGFLKALFLIWRLKPNLIFSKGGFVAVPVVWAGWILRIPIVIHESDITPALATKLTLPFCKECFVTFPDTAKKLTQKFQHKISLKGIPLRSELFQGQKTDAQKFFQFQNPNRKTILIFGGSLGALTLNKKFIGIMDKLISHYNVIHIQGKNKYPATEQQLNLWKDSYRSYDFLVEDMKFAYALADIALCRAGASSLFELAAAGVPMMVFPLGTQASRGDQVLNAAYFAHQGWAQVFDENDISSDNFLNSLHKNIDNIDQWKEKLPESDSQNASMAIGNCLAKYL